MPELYLNGLAAGDLELTLRGLLGEKLSVLLRNLRFHRIGEHLSSSPARYLLQN